MSHKRHLVESIPLFSVIWLKAGAILTMQTFVDDNPKHPLVADAKQVIVEL